MKRLILLAIFFLSIVPLANAQYYGSRYGNGYGGRSRMGSSMPSQSPSGPEPKEITASDLVEERLPDYVAKFELDPFEKEVISTYLEEHFNKLLALQKSETLTPDEVKSEYEHEMKTFKNNLGSVLDEKEVEELIAMDFSPSAKRKRKRKNKN